MNKSLFYTVCTFFLGAFIIVWLYIIAGITSPKPVPAPPETGESPKNKITAEPSQKTVTPTLSHYIIKTSDGKINVYSVYSDGLTKLEKVLDVHPDTLRKLDKIEFDRGIIIKDPEALSHIIEDYVS